MDCRRAGALALSLLAGAAGCSSHTGAVPATAPTPPPVAKADALDPDALKRQPKPETFVAFGDFSAREADGATSPAEQEMRRDRARKAYQEALKADPSYVPAYKALARLYATTKDYARAKEMAEAALKLAPDDATVWFDLGITYARTKQWSLAVDHLTRATELDPENRSYYRYLGFTLARAGRYDECLAAFTRYEGEAKAHYYLAEMLEHLGQKERCKAQLQLALTKDPQLIDAANMLVRMSAPPKAKVSAAPAAQTGAIQSASYTAAPTQAIQSVSYTEPSVPAAPASTAAEPAKPRFLPPPPMLPKELLN